MIEGEEGESKIRVSNKGRVSVYSNPLFYLAVLTDEKKSVGFTNADYDDAAAMAARLTIASFKTFHNERFTAAGNKFLNNKERGFIASLGILARVTEKTLDALNGIKREKEPKQH